MRWRPTPHGQPACSMRRRRSWRPSGCACSTTRPSGSVSSPTCSPRCLRPGPARPASASPPPRVGGRANRCPTTVAGGRRGDGPYAGMGYPTVSSVMRGCPVERQCRTREVMPPSMITSKATTLVSPTMIQLSRHRGRLQRPESVCARTATRGGISKWSVHDVVATPGQAPGGRPVPAGHPGRAHNRASVIVLGGARPR